MLRGSLEDMKEFEKDMKEKMQSKIQEDIQRRKNFINDMKEARSLEGKRIKFIDGFFHEDPTEGIIVGKFGTFYMEDGLIPTPLYELAEDARIAGYSSGNRYHPYKSLFLVVDSDCEDDSEERVYRIENSRMMSNVCMELTENDIEYTSTEETIVIHSNPKKASEIITRVVEKFREENGVEDKEDIFISEDLSLEDEYIDGDTLI